VVELAFVRGNDYKTSPATVKRFHLLLLVGMVSAGALNGVAQNTTSPSVPSKMVSPADSSQSKPFSQWDYLTGDWGGTRTHLSNEGIDFNLTYSADVWGNVKGGIKQEAVYSGLLEFSNKIDFEKLVGWQGATFYSRWFWLSGQNPSADLTGNFFAINNLSGYNTVRNYELWYQQNFFDDKLSIRVGQLAADSEFVTSSYASAFMNGTFGWPTALSSNIPNGGPAYPSGGPGIRVAVKPIECVTIMSAVLQGNVFPQNVNKHGFDWELSYDQGLLSLNEVQWRHQNWLPGDVKAGVWGESGSFVNFSSPTATNSGNYGAYLIADQMLYRPGAADTKQGLGAFVRLAIQPEDRNYIGRYVDGGLNYLGLIPGRDMDTLGLAVACGEVTSGARAQLISQGGSGPPNETLIEATYAAQVTNWLILEPDVQVILNPGGATTSSSVVILGARAVINF